MTSSPYNQDFYEEQRHGSSHAAKILAPKIIEWLSPRSVVDVGCGVGPWLAAFQEYGVTDILGIDGEYIQQQTLQIPQKAFMPCDISRSFRCERRFDLAVSLEVAEHLPESRADSFIADLTALSDIVLFSAAIPGAPGVHHINCQWPSWWRKKFTAQGYTAIDCIRPLLWDNQEIPFWYAQNTLLYIKPAVLDLKPILRERLPSPSMPIDLVHPRAYSNMRFMPKCWADVERFPARKLIKALPFVLLRAVTHRLRLSHRNQ